MKNKTTGKTMNTIGIDLFVLIIVFVLIISLSGCGGLSVRPPGEGQGPDHSETGGQGTRPDSIPGYESVDAGNVHQQGNNANGGWVAEGEKGFTFIGTEYGLYRLNVKDEFYQYTSWPAGHLNLFNKYILFTEYYSDYSGGKGLRAFDLNPMTEPYPTETLYRGSSSNVQLDWQYNRLYFIGDLVLSRVGLEPLSDISGVPEFKLEGIGWNPTGWMPMDDPGDDPDYGSISPAPPPEAPMALAPAPEGVYVLIERSGARYEESVYLYSHDGKEIERVQGLEDLACRGMFWFDPVSALFFRFDTDRYESLRNDAGEITSGVYAFMPGGNQLTRISDDGKSDFALWYDMVGISDENPFPIVLIQAGGVNVGSRPGVYRTDVSGKTPGKPVCLYDGPASSPNIANGHIYFRAPSEDSDSIYDYYRVPLDGSYGAEKLDFDKRIIEKVK